MTIAKSLGRLTYTAIVVFAVVQVVQAYRLNGWLGFLMYDAITSLTAIIWAIHDRA